MNSNSHPGILSAIVQSDSADQPHTLRGLYVFAAGVVEFVTTENVVVSITFLDGEDGGSYPAFIEGGIKRVNATNTAVADADLLGVR